MIDGANALRFQRERGAVQAATSLGIALVATEPGD